MKWILTLLPLLLCGFGYHTPRYQYINDFKDVAIYEMHRKGIPASIKLAQAILESQSGTSTFAKKSNNHFGIKCKAEWRGEVYYHKDDDYDDHGNLQASCFRSYDRIIDSYVDHSNFLAERSYYTELFRLDKTDYVSWAKGLQHCGYATDPLYANKLISIIENDKLYHFDSL